MNTASPKDYIIMRNLDDHRLLSPLRVPCTLQGTALGVPTTNNFVKGASFSPDGTCLLTSSDDTVLRVFEVPRGALETVRPFCDCTFFAPEV